MIRRAPLASARAGRYARSTTTGGEDVWAFVPRALPPEPPIVVEGRLADLHGRAMHALGHLDAIGALLPDPGLFLYMYVRKEAVLSSQIEGMQSSLADLLLHEADGVPGVPVDDVEEASSYVRALDHGLAQIRRPGGLPICVRLLREMHGLLLERGRGGGRSPGEIRRSQNWIGGTRPANAAFVPPPWEEVEPALADLEAYIHGQAQPLLVAAVAHAQFETIHPFLDGNGRIGRQLITLVICDAGLLAQPLLYLSLYLKEHRAEYYACLGRIREHGDWEGWVEFFLEGVIATAASAAATTREIGRVIDEDRRAVASGPAASTRLRVVEHLLRHPVVPDVPAMARSLGMATQTAYNAVRTLEELGILEERSGRRRGRTWTYGRYLAILARGTEAPGR